MAKTLAEIETEAKRLCGTEFLISVNPIEQYLWIEWGAHILSVRKTRAYLSLAVYEEDVQTFARFITICQQLDQFIKE